MRHCLRMDQALDSLVPGDDGAEQNDQDDDDTGEVFDPTQSIGEG